MVIGCSSTPIPLTLGVIVVTVADSIVTGLRAVEAAP
jgi:hypothetical protein